MDRSDAELALRFLEATKDDHFDDPGMQGPHEVRRANAEIIFYCWTMDRINARLAADRAQQIANDVVRPPESAT